MLYYLDTEFIEAGHKYPIDLISVGIISEDDREFYALNIDCNWSKANDWVKANVLNSLPPKPQPLKTGTTNDSARHPWLKHHDIGASVLSFVGADPNPRFVGEWCCYDWVVFAQLFGTMMDLPSNWPMRCIDVVQVCEDQLGLSTNDWPDSLETLGNHSALLGAKTVRSRWEWCQQMISERD